ncbi:putative polygalacturonate 4-alpha-galacturonosyltransferase [Helianthus annuus]|uniref:Hexosyltransferase n=2 Tax=Helianthus annuus TaxID=4232 RepID=A0A9K3JSY9_HELAN|nr:putative polygalacturonate 4-alpha-galacturonosyltransferase [Helianthus annuus]KAJ0610560.1 putative polygalacturonate 4-alpha-galacturonosyltransferase [Helianthus annuus]KAJ0621295.1 putative polygalacturonate 4-alpha-galacturonosyltransferase [Helianthus annuus]KAJ0625811.1 putative polygalacturonate 4-alpha-galacturonosyltransferase [Helianthus annuus]KAJ0782170.1 putative polygalacturonate 4-alpha-galacturonosyltransferase [Helianthus annuus]
MAYAFSNEFVMERSEKEIRESKFAELMNKHFATTSVPKCIHCLSLRLTDDYSSNAHAHRQLPSPEPLRIYQVTGLYRYGINLGGKVNGAVETCKGDDTWVMSKRFRTYFNFSHSLISDNLDPDECAWAYGMNIFNLRAWRRMNIRETYHTWLKEALAYDKRNRTFE